MENRIQKGLKQTKEINILIGRFMLIEGCRYFGMKRMYIYNAYGFVHVYNMYMKICFYQWYY